MSWEISSTCLKLVTVRSGGESGLWNIRLVSSNRPLSIVSIKMILLAPKHCLVFSVGHTKSAITISFARRTMSQRRDILFACCNLSWSVNPRSGYSPDLVSSPLNQTQFSSLDSLDASVVFPEPGRPKMSNFIFSIGCLKRIYSKALGSYTCATAALTF